MAILMKRLLSSFTEPDHGILNTSIQGTIRLSGGSRARSEAFQRHPEGKGTNLDTGFRRYDVKGSFK